MRFERSSSQSFSFKIQTRRQRTHADNHNNSHHKDPKGGDLSHHSAGRKRNRASCQASTTPPPPPPFEKTHSSKKQETKGKPRNIWLSSGSPSSAGRLNDFSLWQWHPSPLVRPDSISFNIYTKGRVVNTFRYDGGVRTGYLEVNGRRAGATHCLPSSTPSALAGIPRGLHFACCCLSSFVGLRLSWGSCLRSRCEKRIFLYD